VPPRPPQVRFLSLEPAERRSLAGSRGATLGVSMAIHALLLIAVIVVPLLVFEDALPATEGAVRAFFAAPPELASAPPPPPPPAPAARAQAPRTLATPPPAEAARLVAPVEVPEQIVEEEGVDLGVEGGVPGGVEGGVPGGVVGGVVGGLPQAPPPEARAAVVRIGGNIRAPKLMNEVRPIYPPLAVLSRVQGFVVIEAHVGVDGLVRSARVVRGQLLLDDAALAAVNQRRYQPLLLNGVPTEFILNVTIAFQLTKAAPGP
jgi:protein TonB